MESIEKIKSTYSRIAEEAQQESNKIQQAIYHTGSLRLLLFVAGIARDYLLPGGKLDDTGRNRTRHPAAVHPSDKVPQQPVSPQRLSGKESRGEPAGSWPRWITIRPASMPARSLSTPPTCMPTIWTYSAHIHCSSTSTAPAPNRENACWQTGWDSISKRKRIYWNDRQPYANWLPNCNSASTSASSACCTKAQQPTKPN